MIAWVKDLGSLRVGDPVETRRALPNDPNLEQSRYIEAAVRGVLVGCLYLPNGNPQPELGDSSPLQQAGGAVGFGAGAGAGGGARSLVRQFGPSLRRLLRLGAL